MPLPLAPAAEVTSFVFQCLVPSWDTFAFEISPIPEERSALLAEPLREMV